MPKKPATSVSSKTSPPSASTTSASTTTTPLTKSTTASHTPSASVSKTTTTPTASSTTLSARSSPDEIISHLWNKYVQETPARTKLLDVFMAFLVLVGGVQFLYCLLAGNYPFNAFLSGFSAAVGQFVLTASLRMQTIEKPLEKSDVKRSGFVKTINAVSGEVEKGNKLSSERAFADYVFGSLILHAFCVNFIN